MKRNSLSSYFSSSSSIHPAAAANPATSTTNLEPEFRQQPTMLGTTRVTRGNQRAGSSITETIMGNDRERRASEAASGMGEHMMRRASEVSTASDGSEGYERQRAKSLSDLEKGQPLEGRYSGVKGGEKEKRGKGWKGGEGRDGTDRGEGRERAFMGGALEIAFEI